MPTLYEILGRQTVGELQSRLRFMPSATRVSKKSDVVDAVLRGFAGEKLRDQWERLDDMQRLAVAETLYSPDGCFDDRRFEAKYGRSAGVVVGALRRGRWNTSVTPLDLFLYRVDGEYRLAEDIAARLQEFVPEPEPVRLGTIDALPEMLENEQITVRLTEHDALADLPALLRLVDLGRIQVSDKTALPRSQALQLVAEKLAGGDFYDSEPIRDPLDRQIGPIKAFAWPLLLQAGGLVSRTGSKLSLSPAGRKALNVAPAASLRTLWQRWLKSGLLDEFNRVDAIKGQRSQGRVMTAVAPRRAAIEAALRACPVGAWIEIDDLSRFMQASDCLFEVVHDPWKLYVADPEYGSLGYDGSNGWNILQLRYMLCLLFEYAATLGIIDVAYVSPGAARGDYRHMWGTDELGFLSRYDGLLYLRLTALGRYCLGLSPEYTPAAVRPNVRLSVLPSLQVHVVAGELSREEMLVLETWAVPAPGANWVLDRPKCIAAIETGHDATALRAFLQARDDQPLPLTVESFIDSCSERGKALKLSGTALLFECQDAVTADLICTHKETAGICKRAGERQLVVRVEHETKFRTLVRVLGFGIAA